MKRFKTTILLCAAILLSGIATHSALADDSLQGVLEETRQPGRARPSSSGSGHHHRGGHHHHHDDEDGFFAHVFADIFGPPILFTITSPWWGPAAAIGDEYEDEADFLTYPYEFDRPGLLVIESAPPSDFDSWSMRVSTEYSTNFSDLHRIGERIQLDTSSRFGFDAEFSEWFEETSLGTENLLTGDANLVFRFAQSENMEWHTGLGMNWLDSPDQGEVGFNFTYGVRYFPTQPVILETTIDWGRLGDTSLFHLHSSAGVNYRNFEVFTGYDYMRIGHQDFHGPLIGGRLWF
ncbi:MAG: hypothetical protein KDA88_16810 [Planctomycetaceae bacterium]|nr:hypothetical protein [Planctomycetaceae bacterium]MCB9951090.1 hypothetical protein [Planctomycetaceae bacterium]